WIERALARTLDKPTGGWFVLGDVRRFGASPRCVTVAGRALVVFRDSQGLVVAPNECPHMGAALHEGRVEGERIVCPWHGLALGRARHGAWAPFAAFDDGVLAWVRLPGEAPSERPVLPPRPCLASRLSAVMHMEARCEPRDVVQNRLDPWHGAHFHPHS